MRRGRLNVETLEALQEVAQRFIKAHKDNDVETQRNILRQLVEDEQSIYQEKQRLLAELKTLGQEARIGGRPEERVARLIALFKFSANLKAVGQDELADEETTETAMQVTRDAFQELKSIGSEGLNPWSTCSTTPTRMSAVPRRFCCYRTCPSARYRCWRNFGPSRAAVTHP
jgi:hypothetical protein